MIRRNSRLKRLTRVFHLLAALLALCFTAACQRDTIPQPAFPLEADVKIAALEKTGLTGEISEQETTSYAQGHKLYVVRSQTETYSDTISLEEAQAKPGMRLIVAGVSSAIIEGERMLSIIFDQREIADKFAWEDWKKQIAFAALLYGGFENEDDVYKAFLGKEFPEGEDSFEWDAKLSGVYCQMQYDTRSHKSYDEYNNANYRQSGTLIVRIYESKALYEKYLDDYKAQEP